MSYSITSLYEEIDRKSKTIENYQHDNNIEPDAYGISLLRNILIFLIIIWFASLFFLFSNWQRMPVWARLLAIFSALPFTPGGPIWVVLIVLITREDMGV
jgi:hypothetical protein